jgi:non-heme chloroperoxidase
MSNTIAHEQRNYINVGQENSTPIDLYYEDHGSGPPVVLIHGWPLSGRSWEKQLTALLAAGRRVITYDRRGFGKSSQPATGYDYDTFAEDLHKLVTALDLRDFALVGFSMGGGEVGGLDISLFDGIKKGIAADRLAFLSQFLANFYNVDVLRDKQISDEVIRDSWNIASGASPIGTLECVTAWYTDFRKDLARIDVPTLIIHGDSDRILPIEVTGKATQAGIKGSRLVTVKGGPHGLNWTHADEVNRELVSFLK